MNQTWKEKIQTASSKELARILLYVFCVQESDVGFCQRKEKCVLSVVQDECVHCFSEWLQGEAGEMVMERLEALKDA